MVAGERGQGRDDPRRVPAHLTHVRPCRLPGVGAQGLPQRPGPERGHRDQHRLTPGQRRAHEPGHLGQILLLAASQQGDMTETLP